MNGTRSRQSRDDGNFILFFYSHLVILSSLIGSFLFTKPFSSHPFHVVSRCLRNLSSWTESREVFNEEATKVRLEFNSNQNIPAGNHKKERRQEARKTRDETLSQTVYVLSRSCSSSYFCFCVGFCACSFPPTHPSSSPTVHRPLSNPPLDHYLHYQDQPRRPVYFARVTSASVHRPTRTRTSSLTCRVAPCSCATLPSHWRLCTLTECPLTTPNAD